MSATLHSIAALAIVAAVGFGPGCKGGKKAPPVAESERPAKPADAAVAAPTLVRRAAVEELLQTWLESQNRGDFAAYAALYAADFRGVRRTGDKRVALDRDGWLADRKRMFRKPVVVVARDEQIAVGPGSAEIHLTQDWSSATFRDVGPKVLRLVERDGALRIAGEEMLRSTVVGTGALPVASARLALVFRGRVVISGSPEDDWERGAPALLEGRVTSRPSDCDDDPPDYEADQSRYWECHNSDPANVTGRYVARAAVTRAGALGRHWRDRPLAAYSADGARCDTRAKALSLWAEIETTQESVGDSAPAIAAAVIEQSNPILVADLVPACPGALYARAPDLPVPPAWRLGPVDGERARRARAELDRMSEGEVFDADGARPTVELRELAPPAPGGRRFVFGAKSGASSCRSVARVTAVWEVKGDRLEVVGEASELGALGAAIDSDGDGAPELVFDNGFLVWRGDRFDPVVPVDFPDLVVPCLCECE